MKRPGQPVPERPSKRQATVARTVDYQPPPVARRAAGGTECRGRDPLPLAADAQRRLRKRGRPCHDSPTSTLVRTTTRPSREALGSAPVSPCAGRPQKRPHLPAVAGLPFGSVAASPVLTNHPIEGDPDYESEDEVNLCGDTEDVFLPRQPPRMSFAQYFYKVIGMTDPEYMHMMRDVHSISVRYMTSIAAAVRHSRLPSTSTFNGSSITSCRPPSGWLGLDGRCP